MNKKNLNRAKKMAREAGYHDVKYLGRWKGHEIVEPIFTDGAVHYIGLPQYILSYGGDKLRWTKDADESIAIMSGNVGR